MSAGASNRTTRERVAASMVARRRKETLFRLSGALATAAGIGFLAVFLLSLISQGWSAFSQTFVTLDIEYRQDLLLSNGQFDPSAADYDALVTEALLQRFPQVTERTDRRQLARLISIGAAYELRDRLVADPLLIGSRQAVAFPVAADVDMLIKRNTDRSVDEAQRPLSDLQIAWIDELIATGDIDSRFNWALLTNGDSREPELAGIRSALMGSLYMLFITACIAIPVGLASAIYLEEFASDGRWTDLIEVNINNLAAVPSIIFGLLGVAVFIDQLSMPRSAPLVGGVVLALLTLPVIIIAARAAIASVPASIRAGALALGASRMQVMLHHVLPQAMPGILTGSILGLTRALGETAPLLMIGMVAFIADVPRSINDPATALPVQIYLWADSPERAFAERTAAAIIVLLLVLLAMNLISVVLRRRMERHG